ncbi:MAG: amidophosphoribosyltransferase [Syntrophothermaceae bacterium]|jgi:amidophosphoribosyltransferase
MEGGYQVFYGLIDDKMKEACGVFGIYLPDAEPGSNEAARTTFYGLYALQHRGQESAGIASSNGSGIELHKGMGLVSEVINSKVIAQLPGQMAIGHVRYPNGEDSHPLNTQPLVFSYLGGMVALAHNGNLINAVGLRRKLARQGSIFQTTADTEILANLMARHCQERLENAVTRVMSEIKGGYAVVMMTENQLVGFRDPRGIRPLCLGRINDGYILASESCALNTVGAEFIRDVNPGEIIIIGSEGLKSYQVREAGVGAHCIFEYIYFARPDSTIDGINVNRARRAMGRQLARESRVDADIVIAVPDSGTSAALGYAEESGILFEEGLMKNRYVGRTFIQPTQQMRDLAVRLKLNPVAEVVKGKRVIMVDDSIVRGTTSKMIVNVLKQAGAAEVHMMVASPPTSYACYYGIDTSRSGELIAARLDVEGIRQFIGADSLHYISVEGMFSVFDAGEEGFCAACFNGEYPILVEGEVMDTCSTE